MNDAVRDSILEAISRLDQAATNRFLGSLLAAEVSLQRLPTQNFTYARDEHEKDGGVDGHLELPSPHAGPFPQGRTKWQFKSGGVRPSAKKDLLGKTKTYLREEIRAGADFVLAWTQSPPDKHQQKKRQEFDEAVRSIRTDAHASVYFGVQLAEMALRHPGVIADFRLSILGSMLSLEDWERQLRGNHVGFLADPARLELTSRLRTWADSTEPPHCLYLFGSAGVGKSRTVLEAFKLPGLAERVLYAPTPASIPPMFWPWILGHPHSRACLVVDECPIDRLTEFEGYANACAGRLRLIAVGDRGPNRGLQGAAEFIELRPLATPDMEKALQNAFGLSMEQATFVSNLAQGYPGLAWSIVQVLAYDPQLDVTTLPRSGSVAVLLQRMLPVAEHRQLLGILALFSNLGFDGDVGGETDTVCQIFDVDVARFRQVVADERDLVGVTGRYRHVTPLLFAIWVGSERLAAFRKDLRDRLDRLPETLYLRFQEQLENFGPNEHAKEVVRQLLDERTGPFDLSALAAFARLLRVAAAVDRQLVMRVIERSVSANRTQLDRLVSRLDLGWTLEYLAWWPDTFRESFRILFLLALDKGASYTDQSSRHLATLFQLHLGGTSVPFGERLDALEELVNAEDSNAARILAIDCLGASLTSNELRMATTIHGGTPLPDEWRPSPAEVLPLRERALRLMLDYGLAITDENAKETALVKIAGELPMLLYVLPGNMVIPKLEAVDWPSKGRAKLAQGLRMILTYDALNPEYASTLRSLAAKLRGDTFDSLVAFVFAASPWELAEGRMDLVGTPEVVKQLGDQLVADEDKLHAALILAAAGDPLSVGKVFERVGEKTSARDETFESIISNRSLLWPTIIGFLVGRERAGDKEWVTHALRQLADDSRLLSIFTVAVAAVEATDERAEMVLSLLGDGRLKGRDLVRLRFGGWILGLGVDSAVSLIDAVAQDDDDAARELTLALLDHYSEERPESRSRLRDLAARLLTQGPKGTPMTPHYRQQLTRRFSFSFETRLEMFLRAVKDDSPHVIIGSDAELFDGLVKEQPTETVRAIADNLLADVKSRGWSRWAISIEEFHFLGRAVGIAGKDAVALAIQQLDRGSLPLLLPHFDYQGPEPNPLLIDLIESGDDDLRRVATGLFLQHPRSFMGSQVTVLQRRRADAEAWSKLGGPVFKSWARSLLALYDKAISVEAQNEAEADALLG